MKQHLPSLILGTNRDQAEAATRAEKDTFTEPPALKDNA